MLAYIIDQVLLHTFSVISVLVRPEPTQLLTPKCFGEVLSADILFLMQLN